MTQTKGKDVRKVFKFLFESSHYSNMTTTSTITMARSRKKVIEYYSKRLNPWSVQLREDQRSRYIFMSKKREKVTTKTDVSFLNREEGVGPSFSLQGG